MARKRSNALGEIDLREKIRTMKAAGATFRQISAQLDVPYSSVYRRYHQMVNQAAAEHTENVAAHREELGHHYEIVLSTMLQTMIANRNNGLGVNAANAVLRALRQIADLYGLNIEVMRKLVSEVRTIDDADLLVSQIERWLEEASR